MGGCREKVLRLTVIVAFNSADQAEELYHPTEVLLHFCYKHASQDLMGQTEQKSLSKSVLHYHNSKIQNSQAHIYDHLGEGV